MGCFKCNKEFKNQKDKIKCADCALEFHAACCRIRTASKLSSMTANAIALWKCDACSDEVASVHSRSDSDEPTVLDLLKSIKKEMKETRQSNEESFSRLEGTLEAVSLSLVEVRGKLSAVEVENKALRDECERLKMDNNCLSEKVTGLQSDILDIQQYSRNCNLEIRGVPRTREENIYTILESVGRVLGLEFKKEEFSVAHRLPAPRDKRFHPSIVAQFISRTTRTEWLTAAKKKRLQTTDLSPQLPPGPVYVNEHLTVYFKSVLGRARSLVRDGKLAFAWSRDGKIFVRRTAESPAVRVRSLDEVEIATSGRGHTASD